MIFEQLRIQVATKTRQKKVGIYLLGAAMLVYLIAGLHSPSWANSSLNVINSESSSDSQPHPLLATASVGPPEAMTQVDDLTRQIILNEVELERFNLHYKKEVGKQGRWRGLRYSAFQEANFSLNLANGIVSTSERSMHFNNPQHVSANRVEKANVTGMVGSIIGASAAAFELGITEFQDLRASHDGFSPRLARAHVLELKNEIDRLMDERESLIKVEQAAPLLNRDVEIDLLEGKVLKDLRDLTLAEFGTFHIRARRSVAFQKSIYFLDMSKFTCSAIGSFFAYMALHKHDRKWNTRAGVLFATSGALIMTAPILSRLIGVAAEKYHKHFISPVTRDAQNREVGTLQADEAALEQLCGQGNGSPDHVKKPLERVAVYHIQDKGFQGQLHQSLQEQRAGKLTATQNIGGGLFVGACKLTSGILFIVPGVIANGKTLRDDRVTNYNLGAAAIVSIPGSSVAILDTLRIQIKAELTRRRQIKTGTLPRQLLDARLAQLDEIEKRLAPGK